MATRHISHGNINIIIVSVDQVSFTFKYNFGYVIYFANRKVVKTYNLKYGFPVSCFFLGFGYSAAITLVNRIA